MKYFYTFLISALSGIILYNCAGDDVDYGTPGSLIDWERAKAGGETTIYTMTNIAYRTPAPNLSPDDLAAHNIGDAQFEQVFVTAPAPLNSGLGPVYNNSSCIRCHPSDGRARVPSDINSFSGFFYRISLPGTGANNTPVPVPGFGTQAKNHAIAGFQKQMDFKVVWTEISETLADGTIVKLRKPAYFIENPYTALPGNVLISPRIAPPVFGLGLLEAIPEADILALADPNDSNGDGIKGIPNYVWNPFTQQTELGRFGWKANTSTLLIQTASAYHEDMGITSYVFPQDTHNDGLADDPEISDNFLNKVVLYCQTLAVPAARNVGNPQIENGYKVFNTINCSGCHVPKQRSGYSPISALANQTFYPFTDMLLHDMGEALADGKPDFLANGRQWKTRPLWGIGLQQIVNSHTEFLHDGRARNITEAILWHGGEAENSKNKFKNLSTKDREDLLKFLNSL